MKWLKLMTVLGLAILPVRLPGQETAKRETVADAQAAAYPWTSCRVGMTYATWDTGLLITHVEENYKITGVETWAYIFEVDGKRGTGAYLARLLEDFKTRAGCGDGLAVRLIAGTVSDRADGGWNFTPYSYAKEAVVQLEARPFVADAEAAACKDVQRQKRAAVRAGMEAQFDKKRFLSMFKTGYVWVDQRDALDFKDQETGSGIDGEPYRLIRMKLRDVALRVDDGDSEDACQKVLVYTFVLDDGVTWTAEDPFETWGDLKLAKGFYWQNPISAKWPKSFQAAIRNQKVMLGMSREQARVAWGAPDDINTTITAGRRSEQWVYDNKVYIYFDNGRLSSIQN